jgi:23S rRNA (guanine745-N1)-methyltransferase
VSALACPIDLLRLTRDGPTWRCTAGHGYDVSKEGYVNLLPPGKPSRQKSGDDLESIHARRRFLDDGNYAALAEALADWSRDLAPATTVDVGCGEGYYTARLAGDELIGLDLSRAGVRLAARRYKNATFAVGNAMALPIADGAVDLAVSVFAPVVPDQFARVVRTGGRVLVAIPGADHLAALRARLYEAPQPHDEAMPLASDDRFVLVDTRRIGGAITLPSADALADLLTMTPYRFAVPPEAIARAKAAPVPFTTAIAFVVSLFVRH